MKLVTYRFEEALCVGAMDETLSAIHPIPGCGDLAALIASGTPIVPAEETVSVFDVELLSPIPHPAQDVICLGINYYDHAAESDAVTGKSDNVPKNPIYFAKRVNEAVAPGAAIPSHSDIVADLDYEAELAVVIGKPAYNVSKEEALDYVFGYTILNDVTARELQTRHKQWHFGKSLDGFCPMGPCIATADELPWPPAQRIYTTLNGELMQDSRTDCLIHPIEEIVSTLSRGFVLRAGTIIATGTPKGVLMGAADGRFLQPGDEIVCTIEGIGELRNTVE